MRADLQDVLLLLGVASIVGGVAMWSKPAALVLFGLICLGFVMLMERARGRVDSSLPTLVPRAKKRAS